MVFVVNAGFFNAKKDFLPIGPYKDSYNTIPIGYPIPELYKDVYGYVILRDNTLYITRNYNPVDQLCSSGPILIEDGKIVFSNNDEARFNCAEDKFNKDLMINQDDDYINLKGYYKYNSNCDKTLINKPLTFKRCDKIIPGELNHANNPNARTVLCIMDNGDYLFVAVQGRDNEGVGIGLHTLAKSLLNTYPTIKHAINQDGGRSSAIVWRTHDTIYNSNPDRHYYYPLGNLIGMTKK
jgi:hypothetical protein